MNTELIDYDNLKALEAIIKDAGKHSEGLGADEGISLRLITSDLLRANPMLVPQIERMASRYHSEVALAKARARKAERESQDKINSVKEAAKRRAYKNLSPMQAEPLLAVKRHETADDGQLKGTIATSPMEMHELVRKAYQQIYDGSAKDKFKLRDECIDTYGVFGEVEGTASKINRV